MPKFFSCSPTKSNSTTIEDSDSLLLRSNGNNINDKLSKQCIFCDVSKDKGFNVIYEDNRLIAFHDRTPRADIHLLIIPRNHTVSSVEQLRKEHIPLIQSMRLLANDLIPTKPTTSPTTSSIPTKMGFHIPPFSSVPHLHLHVFSGKHTFIGKFKYPISTSTSKPGGKGTSWFVTVDQVENILQSGGTIGLGRA
ncbi:uncharacterized protein L201_003033 [Kwoniella dendrophila CBS 6074]|uniref:HIT domain-containing protein n=1 Tax=Kwoniella dendrophila CBS 6074 TaxID=1295534 RepID=A0AAX4JTA0_9TREE